MAPSGSASGSSYNASIEELPVLGIRKRVLYPGFSLRLTIGRPKSVRLAQYLFDQRNLVNVNPKQQRHPLVFVTAFPSASSETSSNESNQKTGNVMETSDLDVSSLESIILPEDAGQFENDAEDTAEHRRMYRYGTVARVVQLDKLEVSANQGQQEPRFAMIIEGMYRGRIESSPDDPASGAFTSFNPFYRAKVAIFHKNLNAVQVDGKEDGLELGKEVKALELTVRKSASELVGLMRKQTSNPKLKTLSANVLDKIDNVDVETLCYMLASITDSRLEEKQVVLAEGDIQKRLEKCLILVKRQIEIFKLSDKIQSNIDDKLKNSQREFYLRQQLKAIQSELNEISKEKGEGNPEEANEVEHIGEKLEKLHAEGKLPKEVKDTADKELSRLKSMQPQQPEYNVIKTYLDLIADLPWNDFSEDNLDINGARKQLDKDHFGLEKVKKRILEFLAVMALTTMKQRQQDSETASVSGKAVPHKPINAPILCLVGPPGVGKTSLGKSIAKCLNRQFVRFSLGGVRDEAEIRGHRKTYIGALPGKVIQSYRKAKTSNPLILLDEIDKVSSYQGNTHGDVASALLEVLDPEQNDSFTDHYLNLPYDLSHTLFIATANDLSTIPRPLLDRMEIIEIPSYTMREKVEIAKRYLVPKQMQKHSLNPESVVFEDAAIEKIIENYTREAGVRGLERMIAAICRHLAVRTLSNVEKAAGTQPPGMLVTTTAETDGNFDPADALEADDAEKPRVLIDNASEVVYVTKDIVQEFLGLELFETDAELNNYISKLTNQRIDMPLLSIPGVSLGLAYTPFGGDILFIETAVHYGSGRVHLTGHLGQVMSESVNTALSFIKANVGRLGLRQLFAKFGFEVHSLLKRVDFHIHFPSGAVPKDGPSAGVAICAAILSGLSGICARSDTACTGEISLRGVVLPVGGIKEKVLAAHRAGLKRVVLPWRNSKDIAEIPKEVRDQIEIIPVKHVLEALTHIFVPFQVSKAGPDMVDGISPLVVIPGQIINPPRWLYDFPSDFENREKLPALQDANNAAGENSGEEEQYMIGNKAPKKHVGPKEDLSGPLVKSNL